MISQLGAAGLSASTIDSLMKLLHPSHEALIGVESVLSSCSRETRIHMTRLFDLIAGYGNDEWVRFDLSTVRGLSYYTGTVIEAFDRKRKSFNQYEFANS